MNWEEEFGSYEDFEYRGRRPTNKLVEMVGINDAPFVVQPTVKGRQIRHPAYEIWVGMLKRCYNIKYKEIQPTYKDITCCSEWLTFSIFAKWFKEHYIHGYQLDKDLLIKDNRVYSPNTCIFVPSFINSFIALSTATRGDYPVGVDLKQKKFRSRISILGNTKLLGSFDTPEEAHKAWQKAKLEQAIAFNFPPLQRVIDQLKFEIENNLETISL